MTPFLLAIIVCIIPIGFVHWILMLIAGVVSGYFLTINIKNHVEGVPFPILAVFLFGVQLLLAIILKALFLRLFN